MKGFTVKSFLSRLTLTALAVAAVLSLSACAGVEGGQSERFGGPPPDTLVGPGSVPISIPR